MKFIATTASQVKNLMQSQRGMDCTKKKTGYLRHANQQTNWMVKLVLCFLVLVFSTINLLAQTRSEAAVQTKGHTGVVFYQDSVLNGDEMEYVILVGDIVPNSPAAKTDLRKRDKLVGINGINVGSGRKDIDKVNQLMNGLAGVSVLVDIERSEELKRSKRITYLLEHSPMVKIPKARVFGIGVTLSLDSIVLDDQLLYTAQVLGIYPNSPADKAGVMPGDFIYEVDGLPVEGKSFEIINKVVDRILIDEARDVDISFLRSASGDFRKVNFHLQRIDLSYYTRNNILPVRVLTKPAVVIKQNLNEDATAPQHDKDRDGIPDDEDACPDVKGATSLNPFENGCPE